MMNGQPNRTFHHLCQGGWVIVEIPNLVKRRIYRKRIFKYRHVFVAIMTVLQTLCLSYNT